MKQPDDYEREKHEKGVKDLSKKELHGQYIRQTRGVAGSVSWS